MAKQPQPQARMVPSENGGPPAIVLPCPPDQFSEFIAGLLGKPQTIERYFDGPIEVTLRDAENLYHLLDQRLTSQNDATLVQFTARIVYDDNSSVMLNCFSDFQAYNEVNPLISTGLHLSWTYLIQFKNKSFPEKQTIDVSFRGGMYKDASVHFVDEFYPFRLNSRRNAPGFVRIQHTDRSWGVDIEALLKGQIETLTKTTSEARRIADKYSAEIGFMTSAIAVLVSLVLSYRVAEHFSAGYLSQAKDLKGSGPDALARQVDFLIGLIASGAWTRFSLVLTFFMFAVIIAAIFCGVGVAGLASVSNPSFVLLTAKSVQAKNALERRIQGSWYKLGGSIVGTLFLGVVGNFIFYLCLIWWGP
jgi:hypothetical protein